MVILCSSVPRLGTRQNHSDEMKMTSRYVGGKGQNKIKQGKKYNIRKQV